MKKVFILFFLLISISSFSQFSSNKYKKGTLHLRDGSELRGLVKISGNNVKFKKTKKDKYKLLTFNNVKRVKFQYEEEYLFKITAKRKTKILIKRDVKGKLNLYSLIAKNNTILTGNLGNPTMNAMVSSSNLIYYVGKQNSDYIEKLPAKTTTKKFFKILSKYTSDCQDFIYRIKDKENIEYYFENEESDIRGDFKIKDSTIEKMINYYNSQCN